MWDFWDNLRDNPVTRHSAEPDRWGVSPGEYPTTKELGRSPRSPIFPDLPMTPSSGVRSPAMILKRVVLPVPSGPISAVLLPSGSLKVTRLSSCVPSE